MEIAVKECRDLRTWNEVLEQDAEGSCFEGSGIPCHPKPEGSDFPRGDFVELVVRNEGGVCVLV